jgi:hypothetical protein
VDVSQDYADNSRFQFSEISNSALYFSVPKVVHLTPAKKVALIGTLGEQFLEALKRWEKTDIIYAVMLREQYDAIVKNYNGTNRAIIVMFDNPRTVAEKKSVAASNNARSVAVRDEGRFFTIVGSDVGLEFIENIWLNTPKADLHKKGLFERMKTVFGRPDVSGV